MSKLIKAFRNQTRYFKFIEFLDSLSAEEFARLS